MVTIQVFFLLSHFRRREEEKSGNTRLPVRAKPCTQDHCGAEPRTLIRRGRWRKTINGNRNLSRCSLTKVPSCNLISFLVLQWSLQNQWTRPKRHSLH